MLAQLPVTKEGLISGLVHCLRLLTVLLAVAWLVGGRSVEWLLSALLGLLETLGLSRGRGFIVRLALTLRYSAEAGGGRTWKSMLNPSVEEKSGLMPDTIELVHGHMTPGEQWLAVATIVTGLFALVLLP